MTTHLRGVVEVDGDPLEVVVELDGLLLDLVGLLVGLERTLTKLVLLCGPLKVSALLNEWQRSVDALVSSCGTGWVRQNLYDLRVDEEH